MVVVVTGASSGIGRAIARAFGARKDSVALIARGSEGLDAAAKEIEQAGGRALTLPLDVARRDAVDAAADKAEEQLGPIDVWVNDAMLSVLAPAEDISTVELRRVTDVNYLGTVWGTLAALRHMRPRDSGVVIQIGSALSYRSIPMQSAYCASKAAVRAFTDSLRSELHDAKSAVQLCHLLLPAVNTPQFDVMRNKLGGHAQPMGPIYQPEVIAKAVVHVARKPCRELWIGPNTVEAMLGQALAPGVLDRLLGRNARGAQVTNALPAPTRNNLLRPLPGDRGAHGSFDSEARGSSALLWARLNLKTLAMVAGTFAAATAAALWRWRRA